MARLIKAIKYTIEDGKFKDGRIVEMFDDDEPTILQTNNYETFMDALGSDSMLLVRGNA